MSAGEAPDLEGRVVLITGAGDGLGAALARACATAGATTVLLGRTVHKLERVYDAIVDAGGPEPAIYPLDLEGASPDDHGELAQRVEEALGRLDALVHNAAMLGPQTPLAHYPPLEWARVFQVNVTGPLMLTQACLPLLRRGRSPSVVFVGDDRRSAYWGAYGTSKAAVAAMAEILADELEAEPAVGVRCIHPGAMRTGFRARAFPGALAHEAPPPEEAAATVLAAIGGR